MGKVVKSVTKVVKKVANAAYKTMVENPVRTMGSLAKGDFKGALTSAVDTIAGMGGEGWAYDIKGVGADGYKERKKASKGSSAPIQLVSKKSTTSGLVQQRIGKGGGGSWSEIAKYSTGGKTGKTGAEAAVPVKKSKIGS